MPAPSGPTPGEGLQALLRLARGQDEETAGRHLLERAVGDLVPDEALVLACLSRLVRVPLVHIWTRPHTGAVGDPVLENASRIGRLAEVALPDLTPTYVGHLLALGLVCAEPAGDDLADYFQALLAEPLVLRALARANVDGSTPRVVRQALSLTPLGERLVADAAGPGSTDTRTGAQVESSTDDP